MSRLRVVTESGSVYLLDTDARTMQRTAGEGASQLRFDGDALPYDHLPYQPEVGRWLCVYWITPEGKRKLRHTTPVVTIEELGEAA